VKQVYAELLQAHDDASARNQPFLTEAGASYLRQRLLASDIDVAPQRRSAPDSETFLGKCQVPFWDAACRRLWLGGCLLKEFRQPAPNQTALLAVFQEQGWGNAHIEDPLALIEGEDETDAKRRLHETIKNLNRGLPAGTIHFRGDGTGQGVLWEYDRRSGRARQQRA
jgi:hypothetical protein